MNMYRHELRMLLKSTVIWAGALVALAALYLAVYPGVAADAKDFRTLMAQYPAPVRAALGINLDMLTSLLGYYGICFAFIVLCGAVQGMNLGLASLSREGREKTADFLLVKPVSRAAVVTAKVFAALTALAATNLVYCACAALLADLFKRGSCDWKIFFMISATMFFVQVIFLGLGVLLSAVFGRMRSVLPLSLGTVFGLYFIGAVFASKSGDRARVLSPFRYFDTAYIIRHASYEPFYLIVGAAVAVAAVAAGYAVYLNKDIRAAG